ncbi:MAG: hypothetical protein H7178_03295 [Chitinophagaceae bacterium]|nr:hypothetical protein [Chitinophagaceae bacterium]
MKRSVFIVVFLFIGFAKSFAQEEVPVDKAKLQTLKKQAQALKGLDRKAFTQNRDSAMAIYRKAMLSVDSLKNAIRHDGLKTVPQGAQTEKYLNTKSKTDTSYSIVQFQGSIDETSFEKKVHIAANCFAQKGPLVQHGSTFSVMLMANTQMDKEAVALKTNRVISHNVKYVIQRNKLDGHASFSSSSYSRESGMTTVNTESQAQTKQFIFSFDTLTNIGQVSYLEVLQSHTVVQGGEHAGSTTSQMGVGISAVTDPKKYNFNALKADKASVELDKLTNGQLLTIKPATDGDEIPILVVEKTNYGFKLTCHAIITKDGTTTTTNVTAYIGRTLSNYEAIIKPVEKNKFKYEEWVPEGPKVDGSDDTKGDDRLQFNVIVRDKKDHSKMYNGNFTVEWRLEDVTKYPGFCNNYPSYDKSSDINFDLKFNPLLGKDPNFDEGRTDGTVATTKDNRGKDATVHVISMDYAAWGKLQARITLDDGSFPLIANPYYKDDETYLTIPYDIDENKLADKWETDNHVFKKGFALNWDEDRKPENQNSDGDGYTLFEEYRGFAEHKPGETTPNKQDVHVRTDPDKKDVFVYDRDQLFEKYYAAENPSYLTWHYVSDDKKQFVNMEPDIINAKHRLINFNKVEEYSYRPQFCMALYAEKGQSHDVNAIGITYGRSEYASSEPEVKCDAEIKKIDQRTDITPEEKKAAKDKLINAFNQVYTNNQKKFPGSINDSPLETFIKCSIYTDVMWAHYSEKNYPNDYTAIRKALLKTTVIHEVGHNIGISHHQGVANPINTEAVTQEGYESSNGVLDCALRYPNPDESSTPKDLTTTFVRYCKKNDQGVLWTFSYDVDANGKRIVENDKGEPLRPKKTTSSPKPSDNCFGQIMLKAKAK